jgi:dipeptidyl aminopeptidase/acylaminoacyl peptidase
MWIWIGLAVVLALVLALAIYGGISVYGASTFNKDAKRVSGYTGNTPTKYGLVYEDVSFQSLSKNSPTLRGWWIPNPGAERALIMVHGRDNNRTKMLPLSRPFWDKGYAVLLFDLQGQGTSDGKRYFFGQHEQWDVVAAFNFVKAKGFQPEKIGVVGTSMGASSILLAMSRSPEIRVVVSDSSFASFVRVAQARFHGDTGLPDFFLPGIFTAAKVLYGFDVSQARPEVALTALTGGRIFLIHGDQDTDVLPEHFYRLKEVGGANIVDSWIVADVGHGESFEKQQAEFMQRVTAFLDKELARKLPVTSAVK